MFHWSKVGYNDFCPLLKDNKFFSVCIIYGKCFILDRVRLQHRQPGESIKTLAESILNTVDKNEIENYLEDNQYTPISLEEYEKNWA